MIRRIPLLLAAILLSGCLPEAQSIKDRGADVADTALDTSEWHICRAASVGSVLRRYGTSAERMAAWRALCLPPTDSPLIEPALETAP